MALVGNPRLVLFRSDPLLSPGLVVSNTKQTKTRVEELVQVTFYPGHSEHQGLAMPDFVVIWDFLLE